MNKIRVDVDELLEKLEEVKNDDYVTAELEISQDDFGNELLISAVGFEEDEPVGYGAVAESSNEL